MLLPLTTNSSQPLVTLKPTSTAQTLSQLGFAMDTATNFVVIGVEGGAVRVTFIGTPSNNLGLLLGPDEQYIISRDQATNAKFIALDQLSVFLQVQGAASLTSIPGATAGDVASGATDSGNPVKIGGLAKTSNPTPVSDGQRVAALFDKNGKQVVIGALRLLKGRQVTIITSSTVETTIVTAVAATFLDLYGLVLSNTSATGTEVSIRDATAGGTITSFYVPAQDTRGFMLPESGAWPQATVNNNWTATCITSVASLKVTALYVQNL